MVLVERSADSVGNTIAGKTTTQLFLPDETITQVSGGGVTALRT